MCGYAAVRMSGDPVMLLCGCPYLRPSGQALLLLCGGASLRPSACAVVRLNGRAVVHMSGQALVLFCGSAPLRPAVCALVGSIGCGCAGCGGAVVRMSGHAVKLCCCCAAVRLSGWTDYGRCLFSPGRRSSGIRSASSMGMPMALRPRRTRWRLVQSSCAARRLTARLT